MAEDAYSRENRITFEPGSIIGGFKIVKLLGQGGFGDAYLVTEEPPKQLNLKGKLAMKTEYLSAPKQALNEEVNMLNQIKGECFPRVFYKGETDNVRFCIMPAYGKSIGAVRTERRTLRVITAVPIWSEMLKIIEKLHNQGFVHCDIKPSNFLLQNDPENPLVLIDFGLAMRYMNPVTHKLYPQPESFRFVGTKKYASIHVIQHEGVCRRDDLLSWYYSLIEILRGKLPWHAIRDREEMLEAKLSTSLNQLFTSEMPVNQLTAIWDYLNTLEYESTPNYEYLQEKLEEMKGTSSVSYANGFDWMSFYHTIMGDESESQASYEEEEKNELVVEQPDQNPDEGKGDCCCNIC